MLFDSLLSDEYEEDVKNNVLRLEKVSGNAGELDLKK